MVSKKSSEMGKIKITQVKSPIRRKSDQRSTLIGLGLNKMHRVSVLNDSSSVRGMIKKVSHLLKIEDC